MTTRHTVAAGECFSFLASRYGFKDHKAIYDHPDNAELKRNRPNPNVLMPGDVVVIPDRSPKKAPLAVDGVHRVKVTVPKKELRLVLTDARGEPLASEPYTFQVDGGELVEDRTTDGDGLVREPVPLGARSATLTVRERPLRLRLGQLTPTRSTPDDGVRGVQSRLRNLGYNVAVDGRLSAGTRAAIALFQHDFELTIDGEVSDALIDKLMEEHGS